MGGRLSASPAPHGYLLEGQTHCGLGKNLQSRGRVAAEPGLRAGGGVAAGPRPRVSSLLTQLPENFSEVPRVAGAGDICRLPPRATPGAGCQGCGECRRSSGSELEG